LNVPDTDQCVILTAGHNLISEDRQRTRRLRIETGEGEYFEIRDENVRICKGYEAAPNENNDEDDWGLILVPKDHRSPPFGFGFSLLFATRGTWWSESEMSLTIGGYPNNSNQLHICTGKGRKTCESLLEYSVATKDGLSGSPVFLAHEGFETVVGIQ
jgi:V8-like Glu-specific endopeptidase